MDPIIAVIIAVAAFIVGAAAAGFICFKMGVKHSLNPQRRNRRALSKKQT